jgi:hypothetical protein
LLGVDDSDCGHVVDGSPPGCLLVDSDKQSVLT